MCSANNTQINMLRLPYTDPKCKKMEKGRINRHISVKAVAIVNPPFFLHFVYINYIHSYTSLNCARYEFQYFPNIKVSLQVLMQLSFPLSSFIFPAR